MSGADEARPDTTEALEALGWRAADARWIRLVCLHSGMFLRSQYVHHHRCHRSTASRFVRRVVERGIAREHPMPRTVTGQKVCHIFAKGVYRALGSLDIRHRRIPGGSDLLWTRLLSLDAVIEEPERPWLPDERDKVRYCDQLGIERRALPSRTYRGPEAETVRFFAPWKLPIAGASDRATFVYADPGRESDSELARWTAQHVPLWTALQDRGVHVDVAVLARTLSGAARARTWLDGRSRDRGKPFSPDDEERWRQLDTALRTRDRKLLEAEGGFMAVVRAHGALMQRRRSGATLPITGFSTRVASRVGGDGYGP